MVLCLIALPVFAILSIFSAKYRKLTLDSLECIFRTATFRKCRSGLDERIKSSLTGKVLKFSPKFAGFVYNNYKLLSWIILIIFLWSIYGASAGIYNYVKYGSCNGPSDTGFCVLDPGGDNSRISEINAGIQSKIVYPTLEADEPIIGSRNARLTIIEFGCYACPYTKKAEVTVKQVLDYYNGKVNLQFKTFYIPHHNLSFTTALAASCAQEQGRYPEYRKLLFDNQQSMNYAMLSTLAGGLGMNSTQFNECLSTQKYKNRMQADTSMGLKAGVRGTPTFFIGNSTLVGPRPFRTFRDFIDKELKK